MGWNREHERRFVIASVPIEAVRSAEIEQGYLLARRNVELRVRSSRDPHTSDIRASNRRPVSYVVASKIALGPATRLELELPVPSLLGRLLLQHCRWSVSKTRHVALSAGQVWEIDSYLGTLSGLTTAEAELNEGSPLVVPAWAGTEVTGQRDWSNAYLARYGLPGGQTRPTSQPGV